MENFIRKLIEERDQIELDIDYDEYTPEEIEALIDDYIDKQIQRAVDDYF